METIRLAAGMAGLCMFFFFTCSLITELIVLREKNDHNNHEKPSTNLPKTKNVVFWPEDLNFLPNSSLYWNLPEGDAHNRWGFLIGAL